MKQFLEFIVKNIVENPKEIDISEHQEGTYTNLKFSVGEEDIGKVIGKNGKVIKAIRSLLKINSLRNNKKVYLELVEAKKS